MQFFSVCLVSESYFQRFTTPLQSYCFNSLKWKMRFLIFLIFFNFIESEKLIRNCTAFILKPWYRMLCKNSFLLKKQNGNNFIPTNILNTLFIDKLEDYWKTGYGTGRLTYIDEFKIIHRFKVKRQCNTFFHCET